MSPALIIAAIEGIVKILELIGKIRKNNAVTSAWTPEERAQIDATWTNMVNSPAWQTDAEKG